MCEVQITGTGGGSGGGGGKGAVVVAVILAGSVVAYLATPSTAPAKAAPPVEPAGTPWLAYVGVAAGAVVATLAVALVVRVVLRRRRDAAAMRRAPLPLIAPPRVQRRAIEPAARRELPQSATSWLGEEPRVRR